MAPLSSKASEGGEGKDAVRRSAEKAERTDEETVYEELDEDGVDVFFLCKFHPAEIMCDLLYCGPGW
jgi:hypothetical protein